MTVLALPEILTTRFLVHDHAPGGLWSIDEATLEFLFDHVVLGAWPDARPHDSDRDSPAA